MRYAPTIISTIQNYLADDPRTRDMTNDVRTKLAEQIAAALSDRNPKINAVAMLSAIDEFLAEPKRLRQ